MCQVNTDPMVQRSGYFEVVGKSSEVRTNVLEINKNESTLFAAGESWAQGLQLVLLKIFTKILRIVIEYFLYWE